MKLETLGHAGLYLKDGNNKPLLLTDPWLIGSCYWRSWWLQNYPTKEKFQELQTVKYCYITHEHPDHFHTASIRKLGKAPTYLSPQLPQEQISKFLTEQGLKTEIISLKKWKKISEQVSILSIPLYNDDSVLIIMTPTAVIVNFNDAKPSEGQVRDIRSFIDKTQSEKKIILLSSYSPASIVNSFLKGSKRLSMKDKKEYVTFISKNCKLLKADFFLPFASQVIFYRSDSKWANEYKVHYNDLKKYWSAEGTQLCPPFTTIDLKSFDYSFAAEENYNEAPEIVMEKVKAQEEIDEKAGFTKEDELKLKRKLAANRLFFIPLFPKGIGVKTDNSVFTYFPFSNKLVENSESTPTFTLMIPTQALKDVLNYGHFGDLGITMFTLIQLNRNISPKMIYLFFILITLHDYGHTKSFGNFFKWLKQTFTTRSWDIPQPKYS